MARRENIVDAVKAVLVTREEIATAWLFGSFASGKQRHDSDVDVAVLAIDGVRLDPMQLSGELSLRCGRDVQVVDVQAAPLALRMQVFRHGTLLVNRAPRRSALLIEDSLRRWFDEAPLRRIMAEALDMRLGGREGV